MIDRPKLVSLEIVLLVPFIRIVKGATRNLKLQLVKNYIIK